MYRACKALKDIGLRALSVLLYKIHTVNFHNKQQLTPNNSQKGYQDKPGSTQESI